MHHQKIDLPNNCIFAGLVCDCTACRSHDNLFFCNINIYRSTGTIDRSSVNEKYVSSMRRERARSIDAEKRILSWNDIVYILQSKCNKSKIYYYMRLFRFNVALWKQIL